MFVFSWILINNFVITFNLSLLIPLSIDLRKVNFNFVVERSPILFKNIAKGRIIVKINLYGLKTKAINKNGKYVSNLVIVLSKSNTTMFLFNFLVSIATIYNLLD